MHRSHLRLSSILFFNDTATPEIYTLSLHDALPICNGFLKLAKEFALVRDYATRLDLRASSLSQHAEIGRAHVCTPVTSLSRMPSSACTKKRRDLEHQGLTGLKSLVRGAQTG